MHLEFELIKDEVVKGSPADRRLGSRTQFAHQVMAAAIRTPARKFLASLSYRVAMRRKSLSRQNIRSMRLRLL